VLLFLYPSWDRTPLDMLGEPPVSTLRQRCFSLPLISRSMGVIYGCGLSATSGMVTSAMSGGPGVEAHTTLSAARCRARVHRLQYFFRRRVGAAGVDVRFRSIFQAELDHFRRARPAQLRDKG